MSRTLSLRDKIVRESFLVRFSWAVQDYPRSGTIVREVRREVTATAQEVGMRRAVADLGHPRILAESYLANLGRRQPRWATGGAWGGLAMGAILYLSAAYMFGSVDTLIDLGGGTSTRTVLGATTTYFATDTGIGVHTEGSWQWLALYLVVGAVGVGLGARVWRLWSRVAGQTVTPAPA